MDKRKREDMPQTNVNDLRSILKKFSMNGIKVTFKSIHVSELKPSQENYIPEKVESMRQRIKDGDRFTPVLIANDNRILDGHHRIIAVKEEFNDDKIVHTIKIHEEAEKALEILERVTDG